MENYSIWHIKGGSLDKMLGSGRMKGSQSKQEVGSQSQSKLLTAIECSLHSMNVIHTQLGIERVE